MCCEKKISELHENKAVGPDGLSRKLLKYGASVLCKPLMTIINMSIRENVFPTELKRANVVPVHKKGDCLSVKNYRPVSILSSVSKIFEKCLVEQLSAYFDDIFSCCVSGYRSGCSCQSVLLRFVENIRSSLDNGDITGAVFMDLSKAFDCLPHK